MGLLCLQADKLFITACRNSTVGNYSCFGLIKELAYFLLFSLSFSSSHLLLGRSHITSETLIYQRFEGIISFKNGEKVWRFSASILLNSTSVIKPFSSIFLSNFLLYNNQILFEAPQHLNISFLDLIVNLVYL